MSKGANNARVSFRTTEKVIEALEELAWAKRSSVSGVIKQILTIDFLQELTRNELEALKNTVSEMEKRTQEDE